MYNKGVLRITLYSDKGIKMKNRLRTLTAILLAGVMLAGCGGKSQTAENEKKKTEPTQEVTETPTQEPAAEPTQTADNEAVDKDKKEIEIPNEDQLVADYTSVQGLVLEKASHIAVVVKNTETGYWKAVRQGMDQAVADLNTALGYEGDDQIKCTFEGPQTETSIDDQVNILDAVLAENPDVLCLAAIDMKSCEAQLEAAEENEIPVIILDSGVETNDLVYSVCATDNYSAGREAARRLCEKIQDAGQVAVMAHLQLSETCQDRVKGFEEELQENHPNVQLVNVSYEPGKEDDPGIEEQMKQVLEQYPDLKGYFCTNEVMSTTALGVLEDYEDRQIQMVGFDLGKVQEEAVRSGAEAGVVCQNPYGMGYATVVAAVRAALGMENDEKIDAGFQWLDKDNIDLEENAKFIYD